MRTGWRHSRPALAAIASVFLLGGACILDRAGTQPDPSSQGGGGLVATGGAGAGGGSGATTSSMGAGGTGGAVAVEQDCLNGQDDDDDGLVDCDDVVDCAAFSCVESVPAATAYVALLGGGDTCAAPGVEATFKWCEGCDCADSPGTCSITAEVHGNASCTDLLATETQPGCVDTQGEPRWFLATSSPDNNAGCTPDYPQVPAASSPACSLAQAGRCSGGEACVPASLATSQQRCVLLPGRVSCEEPYTERRLVYEGASDQCACSCATAGSQGCAPAWIAVSSGTNNCSTQDNLVAVDGNCNSSGPMQSVYYPAIEGTISCNLTSYLSDGSLANTLCCMP